jgi:signal transduction histidine kinase
MISWLHEFFNSANLTPHGYCLFWRPELVWTHIVSDGLIATAYYSIPIILAVFVIKRHDIEFGWVFWAFAIFILACGTTHIMGIWTLFYPDYALDGTVKAATAVASVMTAIGLVPLLPKALSLPSPEQLRKANDSLREQVELRDQAVAALKLETAERERAEEQLRQSHKMEAVGQLTAGIAHDFNNLLTVIMGNLEKAKRLNTDNSVGQCLENATHGADRAATLIHQLLSFGRRQPLAATKVAVGALIEQTADVLSRTLGEKFEVRTALPGSLPAIRADAHELRAALLNIALNARDAMPDGGVLTFTAHPVSITASSSDPELTPGPYVQIAIADTGQGMDKAVAERAFEPFFTTKPVGQGYGLGLSQVYGFARQSGGTVTVETAVGHGTTLRIFLPEADEFCPEDPSTIPPGPYMTQSL